MAILAGMNNAAVDRLKQSKSMVTAKPEYEEYLQLEHLMSSGRSFGRFRKALKQSELPCVPYM